MRNSSRRCLSLVIACGLGAVSSGEAFAQFGGGTQTGGTGGTGTGTTFGGTPTGGTATGGTGGSLGGVGGQLAAPQLLTVGQPIDATGGTGFAGRGNAGENFVGGIVQPGQGTAGSGFGQGGFGQGNANQFAQLNRQGQGQINRQTQSTGPSRSERIRPRHRIAFSFDPVQSETVRTTLQSRIAALPTPIEGVQVTLDPQGTATLQGTAATEADAKLASALARLEPGVMKVDNQLTVAENR